LKRRRDESLYHNWDSKTSKRKAMAEETLEMTMIKDLDLQPLTTVTEGMMRDLTQPFVEIGNSTLDQTMEETGR